MNRKYLFRRLILILAVTSIDLYCAHPEEGSMQECAVIIILRVTRGHEEELAAIMQQAAVLARNSLGNKEYRMYQDSLDPTVFCVYERWSDMSYYQAYVESPSALPLGQQASVILEDEIYRSIAMEI